MKIAVLGGGITGLTAGFYLAKNGNQVVIFERENLLGGMAAGFKAPGWDWYLEKTYHHLFANDYHFLNFAKEIGFHRIFFKAPETASLYTNPKSEILNSKQKQRFNGLEFSIYPLDTPLNLVKFPKLNFLEKLRVGLVVVFLKLSPAFSFFEKQTAKEFLTKTMGNKGWKILWQELFRKKFGKYAGDILASFFWARIKKRTKNLGYIEGGFQTFIDFLAQKNKDLGVVIKKNCPVERVEKRGTMLRVYYQHRPTNQPATKLNRETFDLIVSTLPTVALTKIGEKLFPRSYLKRLGRIQYLHSLTLILETEQPLLKKTYWLNNAVSEIPIMGFFQHTNFIDKSHYNNHHILYLGWFVDKNNQLLKMRKGEILAFVKPYLEKVSPFKPQIISSFLFKTPFSQPIYDKQFPKNKPDFKTPVKNFYLANLDMTYPYDRGVNYGVKLAKEVAQIVL